MKVMNDKIRLPDVKKLKPSDRKRLLGCVKAKNKAWRKKNKKSSDAKVPSDVNERHYSDCAKELGLE